MGEVLVKGMPPGLSPYAQPAVAWVAFLCRIAVRDPLATRFCLSMWCLPVMIDFYATRLSLCKLRPGDPKIQEVGSLNGTERVGFVARSRRKIGCLCFSGYNGLWSFLERWVKVQADMGKRRQESCVWNDCFNA